MSKDKKTYRTLSEKEMLDYLEGKRSGREAHDVERHLLRHAFDREAMEGFEQYDEAPLRSDILQLRERIRKRQKSGTIWLKVAAAVAVIMLATSVIWLIFWPGPAMETPIVMRETDTGVSGPDPLLHAPPPVISAPESNRSGSKAELPAAGTGGAEPSISEDQRHIAMASEPHKMGAGTAIDSEDVQSFELSDEPVEVLREESQLALDAGEAAEMSKKSIAPVAARSARTVNADAAGLKVSGQVTDAHGEPMPGVSVIVKGAGTGTVTDLEGRYVVSVPAGSRLVFSFIGFETTEEPVGRCEQIDVELESDLLALSEVVVTAYDDEQGEIGFESAKPATGLAVYREYLETSLRYPEQAVVQGLEGKVVLKLTVTAMGDIAQVEVKRSLGHGCDEEAIRLVKEGPSWEPAMRDGEPIESAVRVKVKFELD